MEQEIWKSIPGLDGFSASSLGRIRRDPYVQSSGKWRRAIGAIRGGKPRLGIKIRQGYMIRVKGKTYRVHRLVCLTFLGEPNTGQVCMHLNENQYDNKPENLAWGTQKENLNAPGFLAYCRSRTGENSPRSIWAKKRAKG